MPEISSLPAMPAVLAGPAPIAGVAPAPSVLPGAQSFLAQLKTALAGLTGVTLAGSQVAATQVTAPVAADDQGVAEDDANQSEDHSADVMPDVLASLGFLPVPAVLQPLQPQQTQAPQLAGAGASTAPLAAPPQSTAAAASTEQTDSPSPTEDAAPPSLAQHLNDAAESLETAPAEVKSAVDQLVQNNALQQSVALPTSAEHSRDPHPATAPSGTTDTPVQPTVVANHAAAQHFGASSGDAQSGESDTSERAADLTATDTVAPQPRDEAMAAGVTTSAPIAAALPTHVRPSEVVNQIAHQADLYRLPGNKGVRIQLHPEDLGGLDVTLRYTAAAGIQLHINAEHASTGALVQAGWNELRDALASQGITPDRLVMSVSAPGEASGMNFSSNHHNESSSFRSDAGLGGFSQGQGQSGGQSHDGEPRRVNRGWFADSDSSATPNEDSSRAALSSARVDYRV